MGKRLVVFVVLLLVLAVVASYCTFQYANTIVTPTPTPTHVTVNMFTPTTILPCTPGVQLPLIPPGMYYGPSYSHLRHGTKFTYNGVRYILVTGAQGRLWGRTSGHRDVLLYAPISAYHCISHLH